MIGEVASLTHEVGYNSMEAWIFVTKSFFTSAQSSEVLGRFWYNIGSKFKNQSTL